MQRLRPLDETECYLRCYGWRGSEETVRVLPARHTREEPPSVRAERLRIAFEARLDARGPEAA